MHVTRLVCFVGTFIACIVVNGCGKSANSSDPNDARTRIAAPLAKGQDEPPTVVFDLGPSSDHRNSPNARFYDCSYQSRGRTARFRIQLSYGALHGDIPMAFGEGKFVSVPGSDNEMLLEDLMQALEAKRMPMGVARVRDLPFNLVVLGENLSKIPGGGLSDKPRGDWISTKIFLPKDGDDGEVFLHLNPVLGKGEFSIKDSDYGDFVLQELAKVL
jgi:hypothetical protein